MGLQGIVGWGEQLVKTICVGVGEVVLLETLGMGRMVRVRAWYVTAKG